MRGEDFRPKGVDAAALDDCFRSSNLADELFRFLSKWMVEFRDAQPQDSDAGDEAVDTTEGSTLAPATLASTGEAPHRQRKPVGQSLDEWANRTYTERRCRDRVFNDPELFGEPAWDMLLDVATAEFSGERLQVTTVCIGSCSAPTTALRWLSILEQRGLVRREQDFSDGRRNFVRLTEDGARKLERYFKEIADRRQDTFLLSGRVNRVS